MNATTLPTPKAPFTVDQYDVFQKMLSKGAPKKAIAAAVGCSVFKVNYWSSQSFRAAAIDYRVSKAKSLRDIVAKKAPKKLPKRELKKKK